MGSLVSVPIDHHSKIIDPHMFNSVHLSFSLHRTDSNRVLRRLNEGRPVEALVLPDRPGGSL